MRIWLSGRKTCTAHAELLDGDYTGMISTTISLLLIKSLLLHATSTCRVVEHGNSQPVALYLWFLWGATVHLRDLAHLRTKLQLDIGSKPSSCGKEALRVGCWNCEGRSPGNHKSYLFRNIRHHEVPLAFPAGSAAA